MKRVISITLVLVLLISLCVTTSYAADTTYSDIKGHWAEASINKWSANGIIKGNDGKFRPEDAITRGEFAVILDRLMAYRTAETNSFSDLGSTFYTDAVLKAVHYGVLLGYPDNTVKPAASITRQDAVVMLFRAFALPSVDGYSIQAKDISDVSGYAREAIETFEALGVIQGRDDGKIYPTAIIKRGEAVKILDNLISGIYSKAGTYSEDSKGLIIVNSPDVTLKDMKIAKSLIIAPGVGEGTVTLKNVEIKGNIIVLGGGTNSVRLSENSTIGGTIYIRKIDGQVRIFNETGKEISANVKDGSDDVILEGIFSNVVVDADVKITLPAGSKIQNLTLNAPADITGKGTIAKATLSAAADNASFETKPSSIIAANGVHVKIAGIAYVSDGNKLTEVVTGGGGGGGGPSDDTTIKTNSVTLYLNKAPAEKTVDVASDACSFDLTSYIDPSTQIVGLKINTSKDTKYWVGDYYINTNQKIEMSEFLEKLGLSENTKVTLGKIRNLGDSFSALGTIENGTSLTVTFNVGSGGYFSFTNAGVTVTATLKSTLDGNDVTTLESNLGYDPVELLVRKIDDKTVSYTMTVTKPSTNLSVSRTYIDYASISKLTLAGLIDQVNKNGGHEMHTLGQLRGMTVTLTYGTKTLTLVFK